MRRHLAFLASFCGMALIAILSLRPTDAVRLEGSLAELTPEAALAQLDAAAGRMAFSENLALIYSRLALESGDTGKARAALDQRMPDTGPAALREEQMAEVERSAGNLRGATLHLMRAYRAEPTDARRLELGLLHRLRRDDAAEIGVLQSVPLEKLTPWEMGRLADLLIRAGEVTEAEALYRRAADFPGKVADGFRASLIDLLAESGRLDAAMSVAMRWSEADAPGRNSLDIVVPVLLDRGAVGQAYALARHALRDAPETSHVLLRHFARSGHRAIVLDLQARRLRQGGKLSAAEWASLIELAAGSGDLRGLRGALALTGAGQVDPQVLAGVLLQLLRFQGPAALVPYHRFLSADLLRRAPLVGAAVTAADGRSDLAHAYLRHAAQIEMTDWDRDIWLSTASRLHGTQAYRQLMSDAGIDRRLRSELAAAFIARAEPAAAR